MRRGRGNVEIPAIVSECLCERQQRKNGYLTDKEETQTDMGNNRCMEAVHFLLKYQREGEYAFQKDHFLLHAASMEWWNTWEETFLYLLAWGDVWKPKANLMWYTGHGQACIFQDRGRFHTSFDTLYLEGYKHFSNTAVFNVVLSQTPMLEPAERYILKSRFDFISDVCPKKTMRMTSTGTVASRLWVFNWTFLCVCILSWCFMVLPQFKDVQVNCWLQICHRCECVCLSVSICQPCHEPVQGVPGPGIGSSPPLFVTPISCVWRMNEWTTSSKPSCEMLLFVSCKDKTP